MTDLGLIWNISNTISIVAMYGSALIQRASEVSGHGHDTLGLTDMRDTSFETIRFEPQDSNIAGTSKI